MTPSVFKKKILKIVKDNENTLIQMNTDQLFSGKLADGKSLPNYSERSVTVFHKRPGPWSLYDTGSFFGKFYVNANKFPIFIDSADLKTPRILEMVESKGKNPDYVFGINNKNKKDFGKNYILPDVKKYLADVIRLR